MANTTIWRVRTAQYDACNDHSCEPRCSPGRALQLLYHMTGMSGTGPNFKEQIRTD